MIVFFFLFLSAAFVHGLPEQGHYEYRFDVGKQTDIVPMKNFVKFMYKNTNINIRVACVSKADIQLSLKIEALIMKCLNKTVNYTDRRVESVVNHYNLSCHSHFAYNNLLSGVVRQEASAHFRDLFANSSENLLTTAQDGIYYLQISFNSETTRKLAVQVDMRSWYGYLSAKEWPLLIFYSVMCGIYSLLALAWLVLGCLNWRDLLRIQFWIGAVILLGMLEKAMFVAEYQALNETGVPLRYAVVVAEIVSCVKRMLARILLMIVCIGYGIVKHRLGPAMKKIIGVGLAYLAAALVEGYIRVLWPELVHSRYSLVPDIVLVVLDTVILWWSFSYLIQTIKQMRVKHNIVKFNLYRHFSNILIIVVIASAVFMIWALYTFKSSSCQSHWKEFWINEAYWHVLFSIVLVTIVILWRPSKNSQRYAYSPLLDADDDLDDDDDNDIIMDNMTSGELRKPSKESHHHHHVQNKKNSSGNDKNSTAEDDLRWIEDNIPASAAEKIYPLVDSDTEITPSKVTAGKMD